MIKYLKKRVFILNGTGGSGKDTFCDLVNEVVSIVHYSYVSNTKNAAEKFFGWKGGKTEKDRLFLAELNTLSEKYNDMPFQDCKRMVDEFMKYDYYDKYGWHEFLFIDCREVKNIERLKKEFNAETIFILRDEAKPITSNHADAQTLCEYDYDYIINNSGDINDLKKIAIEFVEYFRGE